MKTIIKIDPMSLAKILGALQALFGFFLGLAATIIAPLIALYGSTATPSIDTNALISLGWAAIIVLPITYGLVGFVTGYIGAWLYNIGSKWVGGVKIDLK